MRPPGGENVFRVGDNIAKHLHKTVFNAINLKTAGADDFKLEFWLRHRVSAALRISTSAPQ